VMEKFNLIFVASEIALRIYLTIGFAAVLGLAVLAATSTDAMVRRLGKRWKPLHKLIYVIAPLAVLHFFLQSKIDVSEAVLMAGLFILLMSYRVVIGRKFPVSPVVLSTAAVVAAGATALIEFAWYGLATGVDPWAVAKANVMISFGLRPAPLVLLTGIAVTFIVSLRRRFAAPRSALRERPAC
ncbi:MAG: sulfoxide reductase heme-binding subunit YedZ, partial [Alphaproteobacteria bacterium]|nr:sulfoxide reductase heme-binding subunit YedZ [Alphaproteobacteria bacterium]